MSKIIEADIKETTRSLTNIIYQKYREHTHGTLKGYLIPDEVRSTICKAERKFYSSQTSIESYNTFHGSVKCSVTTPLTRSLTAMAIAYTVKNNLLENFKDYPFQKFKIKLETYPKYRFDKSRIVKYQKTGDDITFLKVDIEW